jgi:glutamine synthetase
MHYLDALQMADFIMLYKYVLRRTANKAGLFASFMPKPIKGVNGNGMHVHQSLFRGDTNLFFDKDDEFNLSKTGKQYMAGLLKHIPEITPVLNQWTNSFKRLVPNYEAPTYICWDPENRSNLIRIPRYLPGNEKATRIELRSPDPACNPYLAFAVMLRAGVKGITEKYELPEPTRIDVFDSNQRKEKNIKELPSSLEEAIELAEKGTIVKETFGKHLFEEFIKNKKIEIKDYEVETRDLEATIAEDITPYEIEQLLPIL